ncbi:MAG: hypothetical protein RI894_2523 [Bacteroidota bacterium]
MLCRRPLISGIATTYLIASGFNLMYKSERALNRIAMTDIMQTVVINTRFFISVVPMALMNGIDNFACIGLKPNAAISVVPMALLRTVRKISYRNRKLSSKVG